MANLVAQIKERLLSHYGPDYGLGCGSETLQNQSMASTTASVSTHTEKAVDFSLDCSVQALKGHGNVGLSSRVNYYFPSRVPASLNDVFRYVDTLNPLLQHSEVFVVQDLDGDHSYYLRMDTVLASPITTSSMSILLDHVTEDTGILMQYFRYSTLSLSSSGSSKGNILRKCG